MACIVTAYDLLETITQCYDAALHSTRCPFTFAGIYIADYRIDTHTAKSAGSERDTRKVCESSSTVISYDEEFLYHLDSFSRREV